MGDETYEDQVYKQVVNNLRNVYDPEIPLNIYELGLIYNIDYKPQNGMLSVTMTFTSPACPAAELILMDTELACRSVEGVKEVEVDITWDPPWGPEKISEDGKLALGLDI